MNEEANNAVFDKVFEAFKDNPLAWGLYFFPDHFRQKSPPFHLKILSESLQHQFFAVASPRGSAKSTILTFLKPTHRICFRTKRFIILVQSIFDKAAESLETIKQEFRKNDKLRQYYKIRMRRDTFGDTIFRHESTGFETRFLCKGVEQIGGIRGEKFGAWRPDYIIVDDLEDDVMVKTPEGRRWVKDLFDKALMKAGDLGTDVDVIGTILHEDSQLAKLTGKDYYPEFKKLVFHARWTNPRGQVMSLWPEKWTVEDLDKMERDDPETFWQEMQNMPTFGVASKFNKKDFRRWIQEKDEYILFNENGAITAKGKLRDCRAAICCDLAWEDKRSHDYTVIMPGILTPSSDLLIDNYICRKGMRPNEMVEILFMMESKYRGMTSRWVPIGFEKGKLEKVVLWFLKQEMRKRNHVLMTKSLQWGTDKIERIVTKLEPRYSQHMIFHKKDMRDLEHQLLHIPKGKHDDLADAAQGLVQLLEYPASKRKEVKEDSDPYFEWLRARHAAKVKPRQMYVFGKKTKTFGMPAQMTWR